MEKKFTRVYTMKRILNYVSKYWFYILCTLVCAFLTVTSMLYLPILIGNAIDCIIGQGKVLFIEITNILFKMIFFIILTALSQWIMNVCNNKIAYNVVKDIRQDAFEHIQKLPISYLDKTSYGEIISRVITDAEQFSEGLLLGFTQLFTGVITILGTLFFMFCTNAFIALVVVCITPISLLVAGFIARRTYRMFQKQSITRSEQTALVEEMIGNQKLVKAFGYERNSLERFDEINESLKAHSLKAIFFSSLTNPCTRFVNSLVYTGVGITGALSVIQGGLTVGMLSCFLSYANQYTKPFNEISGVFTEFQNALACAARIFVFLEEEKEKPEDAESVVLKNIEGRVDLKEVSFSYEKDQKLLENISFTVKKGQRVAIVGPTGCGKTTLINLLMRFYDVNKGKICIDNQDISLVTRESLRTSYGMVLQDTWLKAGTIRENIMMGKNKATEEEMVLAAKASHAHSFIRRLPKGYDTVIDEEGEGLSQGQKQLLCITRVMLCLPPLLILDEATSNIDTRTERKIQEAFGKLMKGRTSFVIAHRLSTIIDADMILVMKDGNIIEKGSHEELLKKKGFYAQLYNHQYEIIKG